MEKGCGGNHTPQPDGMLLSHPLLQQQQQQQQRPISRKSRERAKTVRSLHRTTKAAAQRLIIVADRQNSRKGGNDVAAKGGGTTMVAGSGKRRNESNSAVDRIVLPGVVGDDTSSSFYKLIRADVVEKEETTSRLGHRRYTRQHHDDTTATIGLKTSGISSDNNRISEDQQYLRKQKLSQINMDYLTEIKRARVIKSLRETFSSLCKHGNIVPPIYTWERWQCRCKLYELLHRPTAAAAAAAAGVDATTELKEEEEVVPNSGYIDTGCIADLVRGGCSVQDATTIVTKLGQAAVTASDELVKYTAKLMMLKKLPPSSSPSGQTSSVSINNYTSSLTDIEVGGVGMSNRQRKKIEIQRRRAMRKNIIVTTGSSTSSDIVDSHNSRMNSISNGRGRKRKLETQEVVDLSSSTTAQLGMTFLDHEISRNVVSVTSHRHSIDFSIITSGDNDTDDGKKKKKKTNKLYKLNHGHYDKLRLLLTAHCNNRISGNGDNNNNNNNNKNSNDVYSDSDFHKLVYCVLSRYHSVLGHGFQMALSEHVFDVLRSWFNVRFECFASPLNCTCAEYASAFPLVDKCFGATGNFFNLHPRHGSFEANPPFIEEVMIAMVTHIHNLLEHATGPMSFVIIIPGWLDDPSYVALDASLYKQTFFLVAAADHGFCDGAQHQRQDRFRDSTYDTGVFVLQNQRGSTTWPVIRTAKSKDGLVDDLKSDVSVEEPLRRAMANAIPTEMMRLRRLRDGRGSSDLDGGGGVYKGKKVNRNNGGCNSSSSSSKSGNKKKR